jgi:acyl-CoA synthetase (AMP-forming)/AMP-acid ligase II
VRRVGGGLIGDVVAANAERFGDKVAFKSASGRELSFAAFYRRVQQLGKALCSLGIQRGDRIAVLLRNRVEYVEAYCAAAFGFVIVPLNWRLSSNEIQGIVGRAQPRVVISDLGFADPIEQATYNLPELPVMILIDGVRPGWRSYEDMLAGASGPGIAPDHERCPSTTAALMFTSGTTGRPKGVELTHQGLVGNSRLSAEVTLPLTPQDITLSCMPMFHVGGMWYHLFASYHAGCTTYISDDARPATVLALLSQHGITNTHMVPTMLHDVLELPAVAACDLTHLRLILYGASSISPALLRKALDRLQHCAFVQGYGSTEGGQMACLSKDDHRAALTNPGHEHLLLSCGRPIAGVELRIDAIEADGAGEILVRSPFTMARYWRDSVATDDAIVGGWLRTGDIGRVDDEGFFYVLDRKSDMIVTGGENVFPREVEDAILSNPKVVEVAVFGLPDQRWVQRVIAAIVSREGVQIDLPELRSHLKTRLADYKCPKQVILVESLPKNAAGKVLRRELRAQYGHLGT